MLSAPLIGNSHVGNFRHHGCIPNTICSIHQSDVTLLGDSSTYNSMPFWLAYRSINREILLLL